MAPLKWLTALNDLQQCTSREELRRSKTDLLETCYNPATTTLHDQFIHTMDHGKGKLNWMGFHYRVLLSLFASLFSSKTLLIGFLEESRLAMGNYNYHKPTSGPVEIADIFIMNWPRSNDHNGMAAAAGHPRSIRLCISAIPVLFTILNPSKLCRLDWQITLEWHHKIWIH